MKTDITIRTARGLARLVITGQNTFDLRGNPEAVQEIQDQAPVFQPTGNPLDVLPDALGRLLFTEAAGFEGPDRQAPLVSQEELVRRTLTENPLVLFQTIDQGIADAREHLEGIKNESHDEAAVNSASLALDALEDCWTTQRVFLDPEEAKAFVAAQPHRYAADDEDTKWRFYTGIADGVLKRVAKEARDLANL